MGVLAQPAAKAAKIENATKRLAHRGLGPVAKRLSQISILEMTRLAKSDSAPLLSELFLGRFRAHDIMGGQTQTCRCAALELQYRLDVRAHVLSDSDAPAAVADGRHAELDLRVFHPKIRVLRLLFRIARRQV
jgi:hypothetical protein